SAQKLAELLVSAGLNMDNGKVVVSPSWHVDMVTPRAERRHAVDVRCCIQQDHTGDNRVLRFVTDEVGAQRALVVSRDKGAILSHAPRETEQFLDIRHSVAVPGRVRSGIIRRKPRKFPSGLPSFSVVNRLLKTFGSRGFEYGLRHKHLIRDKP